MKALKAFVSEEQHGMFEYEKLRNGRIPFESAACVNECGEQIKRAMKNSWVHPPKYEGSEYRASMLGRNIWLSVWDKFKVGTDEPDYTWVSNWKMFYGYVFEEMVYYLLCRLGYKNIQRQISLEEKIMDGVVITGHPDFLVEHDDGKTLIECKARSNEQFKRMLNSGPGMQYHLQLQFYHHKIQPDQSLWLIQNRDTMELAIIDFKYDVTTLAKPYLYMIHLHNLSSYLDAFRVFPVPAPSRHQASKYRYVPYWFYIRKGILHPVVHDLYKVEQNEKGTNVITGYNFPKEVKEYEQILD